MLEGYDKVCEFACKCCIECCGCFAVGFTCVRCVVEKLLRKVCVKLEVRRSLWKKCRKFMGAWI